MVKTCNEKCRCAIVTKRSLVRMKMQGNSELEHFFAQTGACHCSTKTLLLIPCFMTSQKRLIIETACKCHSQSTIEELSELWQEHCIDYASININDLLLKAGSRT